MTLDFGNISIPTLDIGNISVINSTLAFGIISIHTQNIRFWNYFNSYIHRTLDFKRYFSSYIGHWIWKHFSIHWTLDFGNILIHTLDIGLSTGTLTSGTIHDGHDVI